MIVIKDEEKRLITAPVLIPNYKDCDSCRGEKELTTEEIESISHEYMAKYRIVDKMHDYFKTGQDVADVVESWQLRKPEVFKNLAGEEKEYPAGTWMATTRVNNDTTWNKVKKGIYNGYSVTALSKNVAEQLGSIKSIDSIELANKGRVLIKDLEDPVGYTISLVPKPCVYDAKFCTVKSFMGEEPAEKAGRSISNATLDRIRKTHETLQAGLDNIKSLLSTAENERKVDVLEDMNMEKEELQNTMKEVFKSEMKPLEDKLDTLEGEMKELKSSKEEEKEEDNPSEKSEDKKDEKSEKADAGKCSKCGATPNEGDKFCASCGTKVAAAKSEEDEEEDKSEKSEIKALKTEVENLKKEVNKSNALNEEKADKTESSRKGRDEFGVPL